MRVLICAGGTGGGVYPALAVHKALKTARPDVETLWVGGAGGMEAGLVERAGVPFKTIPAAGLHGVSPARLPGNVVSLTRGLRAAQTILAEFKPDALFFTGGYVAAPMALAGRKIPALLYVPDIEPGWALKALTYFASRIAVTAAESRQYFSSKTQIVVTGYPVREELRVWERDAAQKHFDLTAELPVLLVFGGSKGAHSINVALLKHLKPLLEKMQVIHISGDLDWEMVESSRQGLPQPLAKRYRAYPYLHDEMGAALAAADLAVSRAGAAALGEYPLFGLPAVLAPYPYGWRYQQVNAETLARRGGAVILDDANLESELGATIFKLFERRDTLQSMREAMRGLNTPGAAAKIAAELINLAGGKHG